MSHEPHIPADHAAETHPSPAELGPGYEVRDAKVGGIVLFVVGMFITLVLTQVGLWGLLKVIAGGKPEPAATGRAPLLAGRQREQLLRSEDAVLNAYGRAEPGKTPSGPVRIPVDRAVDLIADRGLPAKGGPARTEVEVNSHSGESAPAGSDKKGSKK